MCSAAPRFFLIFDDYARKSEWTKSFERDCTINQMHHFAEKTISESIEYSGAIHH